MVFEQFCRIICVTLCISSCKSRPDGDYDFDNKIKPSQKSNEDDLLEQGDRDGQDTGILPDGFEIIDGVVLDTTNLLIQDVTDNGTIYKTWHDGRTPGAQIQFKRPKREAGWHFVLFEDPVEESGTGHLILFQKLLGFTVTMKRATTRELRLYEMFHVDLR